MDSIRGQGNPPGEAMEEAQEFCQARVTDCYDCAEAASCPALNELFLKYYKKNGVNNYQATTRAVPHPKNSLNELGGAEWLYFTKTLLTTSYSRRYGHELRKAHGANKPPELMKHLIEFFTRGGDRVLDPFAGVGGTLLGAAIAAPPRQCTGIEINPKWIDIYHRVVEDSNSRGEDLRRYEMIQGDCLEVLRSFDAGSFQFIATDPPYNRHLEKTMCTGQYRDFANRQTDYDMRSDDPLDLANLSTYAEYLDAMERVLGECYRVLEPKKYLALIIRDAYQDGEYIFTHVDIARRAGAQGFTPKGEIVWYEAGTRLRPYGYPYAYVPNIAHQYIVILRKEKSRASV